jgi:hypothetical protein
VRKAAEDDLKAATEERSTRRKERVALWSQFLLARVREIDPSIDHASIDPDDYTALVDNTTFEDSSVAGGPRTIRNVCVLLALRDLGRAVPAVLVPPLLVIDSPANGFGAIDADQQISRRLMDQIITVAADPSTDGYACQVITASNDAHPGPPHRGSRDHPRPRPPLLRPRTRLRNRRIARYQNAAAPGR